MAYLKWKIDCKGIKTWSKQQLCKAASWLTDYACIASLIHCESQIFYSLANWKKNMFIVVIEGKGYWKFAKLQNPSQTECYTFGNCK